MCREDMSADALAYIQQLEAQKTEQAERIKHTEERAHQLDLLNLGLLVEKAKLEAERDALTKLVKEYRPCWECEYRSTGLNEPCLHCDKDNNCFEWRGVQKEAFDDPQATD